MGTNFETNLNPLNHVFFRNKRKMMFPRVMIMVGAAFILNANVANGLKTTTTCFHCKILTECKLSKCCHKWLCTTDLKTRQSCWREETCRWCCNLPHADRNNFYRELGYRGRAQYPVPSLSLEEAETIKSDLSNHKRHAAIEFMNELTLPEPRKLTFFERGKIRRTKDDWTKALDAWYNLDDSMGALKESPTFPTRIVEYGWFPVGHPKRTV